MALKAQVVRFWLLLYRLNFNTSVLLGKHRLKASWVFAIALSCLSPALAIVLQPVIGAWLQTQARIESTQNLLLTLGGALMGAAAIAFSLIMFAMQVNIERVPHGLFRRVSSDARLLGAFIGTFLLALGIAALSLIVEMRLAATVVVAAAWGTTVILLLFLFAYRRALHLINPLVQLNLLLLGAQHSLRSWATRANRLSPLFETQQSSAEASGRSVRVKRDVPRALFFRANAQWTGEADRVILQTISMARRFAEQGDYEISGAALSTVVGINQAYIAAKGRTFFPQVLLVDNPLTADGSLTNSLEHLRQLTRSGVSRGDERQIEQTLRAFVQLATVYAAIDYAQSTVSKTHALLAAGYLSDAVQSVVPHDMPDVLMEGLRLIGQTAETLLALGDPVDVVPLVDKTALIACTGAFKENYRPVTHAGMHEIAKLTFSALQSKSDQRFLVGKLTDAAALVAKTFLTVPDPAFHSNHSTHLASYYSCATEDALPAWLVKLNNALADAKADSDVAQNIIRNIETWADGLYAQQKELLVLAIEKKSVFAFDIVHWLAHVTKILLAVSTMDACSDWARDKFRHHATWLIGVCSWVPDTAENVRFIESVQLSEVLFESAWDAHQRGCDDVANDIRGLLISWAFVAGKYQIGWGTLERSLYGLAAFATLLDDSSQRDWLKSEVAKRVTASGSPSPEILDRTARDIRERAADLSHAGSRFSEIESAMGAANEALLRPLLQEVADLLSPGTAGETVHVRRF